MLDFFCSSFSPSIVDEKEVYIFEQGHKMTPDLAALFSYYITSSVIFLLYQYTMK